MYEKISIIIPIYNEAKGVDELISEIVEVMSENNYNYEVVAVNDCSEDDSFEKLAGQAKQNENVKVVSFRRNYGQTAALTAGIHHSSGDILITMDGDLENDPRDIPKLLKKLIEGYDVVSGWRKDRWKESFFSRRLPSIMANWFISYETKLKLHDYGCILKAYRREVIEDVQLYGEMHRFLPFYAKFNGAKVAEVVVNFRPRKYGNSNYNLRRVFKVIVDLGTVVFIYKYFTRPIHFFGRFGFYALLVGFLSGCYTLYLKVFKSLSIIDNPMTLLTVFMGIIGMQFMLMGLIAEILIRNYFETGNRRTYLIKKKINFTENKQTTDNRE